MCKISNRFLMVFLAMTVSLSAAFAQKVSIKNNLLYDATLTPNLGVEFSLGSKSTLDFLVGLNPFDFSGGWKAKHLLLQPEYRYWLCDVFNGHFFGIHSHFSQFNVGGFDLPLGRLSTFADGRYQGYLYGGGISYGYQWILSPRWNLEASIGGGFARVHYDEYPCAECGTKLSDGVYDYWGVTRGGISLIYFIK